MKHLLITLLFSLTLFSIAHAQQNLTGPGLGDEQPPTAGLDQQDDNLGKPETLPAEDVNAAQMGPRPRINPLNERGPKGREAQEEARTDKFDLNQKEIKKKQKGQ